jgi:glutaminase
VARPEQMVPQTVDPGVVARIVTDAHQLCRADDYGDLADCIPELAAVQPDSFGLCPATADGRVYGTGDATTEFTIQSISKPFTYALALADRDIETVAEHIGIEPSGHAFNEISLAPVTERPRNPMINTTTLTERVDAVAAATHHRWVGRTRRIRASGPRLRTARRPAVRRRGAGGACDRGAGARPGGPGGGGDY